MYFYRYSLFMEYAKELQGYFYIKAKIEGKKFKGELLPWYKGFKGSFRYNTDGKLEILGVVKQINSTKYVIEELPIFVEYSSYIDTLDKLIEKRAFANVGTSDNRNNRFCHKSICPFH